MGSWLLAKYSLYQKKLYQEAKPKIPQLLQEKSFLQNRKRLLKFVAPLVGKAYREGIRYARAWLVQNFHQNVQISPTLDTKTKEELFREFFVLVRNAESVYQLKMEQRKKLLKVEGRESRTKGSDIDRIRKEYETAVSLAVNNLILNAGDKGVQQAVEA